MHGVTKVMSTLGDGKLERKIAELQKVAGKNIEGAIKSGCRVVQAQAKLLCPVDHGELRQSIHVTTEKQESGNISGIVYTDKAYAMYVEFGTGPVGEKNHDFVSPSVNVAYTLAPWWIHESVVDKKTAEKYKCFSIETKDGIFYQVTGQPAQPFMYPALHSSKSKATERINKYIQRKVRESLK